MRPCELSALLTSLVTAGVRPSAPIKTIGFNACASERCAERSAEDNSSIGIGISLEGLHDKRFRD